MDLVLHIGLHKTGTTSIQKNLRKNAEVLSKEGVFFNPTSVYTFICNQISLSDLGKEMTSLNAKTVVISREQLSWRSKSQDVEYLNGLKKWFDDIKVVLYLRRQDKLAISHKHQGVKNLVPGSFIENRVYGLDPGALPKKDYVWYLDYWKKYKLWSDVFGSSSIILKDFDAEVAKGRLLESFCSIFHNQTSDLEFRDEGRNASLGGAQCEVLKFFRKKLVDNKITKSEYEDICLAVKKKGKDSAKLLPSKKEAILFYSYYHESNFKLKTHAGFSFEDEDFSKYPDEEALPSSFDVLRVLEKSSLLKLARKLG